MRRRAALALVVAGTALVPASIALARVAATGTITRNGTDARLDVRNDGDEVLRCLRFTAAEGVELLDAAGPGETQLRRPRSFTAQGFEIAPGVAARWRFTTRDPYPEGAGGGLEVSSTCQEGSNVGATVNGPAPPAPPPPTATPDETVTVLRGVVRVRRRASRRFVRVAGQRRLADGSELDTRRGRARITVPNPVGAGATSAVVSGGRATVDLAPRRTSLRLSEPLTGCRRARGSAAAAAVRVRQRSLTVDAANGFFITRGRYGRVVATDPARWRTTDTCRRTVVDVTRGRVAVTGRSGRTVTGRPGRRVVVTPG